jgi:transcriptional regulator with XRE-family HTH domain
MRKKSTAPQTPPLRAVRLALGLTLEEVSEKAGINVGHLSRVERGEAGISIGRLARVARVLGLTELERHLTLYSTGPPAGKEKRAKARPRVRKRPGGRSDAGPRKGTYADSS